MKKVGVIGAGSWGTALSCLLYQNGHQVTMWSIVEEEVIMLREKREHETKLPGSGWRRTLRLPATWKLP